MPVAWAYDGIMIALGAATQLFAASATLNHRPWRYTAYITNLTNKQEILVPPVQGTGSNSLSMLADDYVVNPPREFGLRVGYSF